MRLPMMARYRVSTLAALVLSAVLLAGCAGESIAPSQVQTSQVRTSPFVPTAAQKALVGVSDGSYQFEIDPSRDERLQLGASRLEIPANAVCDIDESTYGPEFWNDECALQTEPFTVTAVVRNAATDHPSVDFEPALRFSPSKQVELYLYVTDQATLDAARVVKYCNADGCVDESINDSSVASKVDLENRVVFRRIKHFSGFIILRSDDGLGGFDSLY
jgi:hypothetical protein